MHRTLKHFDMLTERGLKVIPLRTLSKVPVLKQWNSWNKDICREVITRNPDYNIGLLLGEIIDIEGDSVEANEKINSLLGNYPHPAYQSAKSTHHLFLNPDPNLTILKYQNIEFRAYRHQSVLPPSVLENNTSYQWLGPITFPFPVIPDKLMQFFLEIKRRRKEQQEDIKPGHMTLNCSVCREECYIHCKRFKLELIAFKDLGMRWTCHACREVDIRETCRQIRRCSI